MNPWDVFLFQEVRMKAKSNFIQDCITLCWAEDLLAMLMELIPKMMEQ